MGLMANGPETRERAAKIGPHSLLEEDTHATCPHCETILEIVNGLCRSCGKRVSNPPKIKRAYDQWPAKKLHARGILSDVQFAAAEKYYEHWKQSGMVSFGSINLESVGSSREPKSGMPASERQAHHRQKYRQGEKALGPLLSPYVNAIVLLEQEPEAVGKRLTGRRAVPQARAVAIEMLKGGLDALVKQYELG